VSTQLLCFDLGAETYAIDLARVREIAPLVDVVRVPATPSFVRGLLPRQEQPVPVIDLAVKFGLTQTPGSDRLSVVVVDARIDGEPALMGFLVDARSRVVECGEGELEAVPELGARIRVEFLRGVAHVEERLAFVVDLDRMLSATDAEALDGLAAEHLAELEAASDAGSDMSSGERPAAASVTKHADEAREEYVVFSASGERLALGLAQVRELLHYGAVTPVPGAREWIRGVTNRRGQVTAVIDLAKCLGLPPTPVTARSCILVLDIEVEGSPVAAGIAIDDVLDVVSFARQKIEAVPRVGVPVVRECLRGVARVGERFVSLLDVDHLLPLGVPSATDVSPAQA
jgi:purine-binding chemotaxis protein CheW